MSSSNEEPISLRFILGFILVIFLVLVYTLVGEFPIWIVGIPVVVMGFDLSAIIEVWRNNGKK